MECSVGSLNALSSYLVNLYIFPPEEQQLDTDVEQTLAAVQIIYFLITAAAAAGTTKEAIRLSEPKYVRDSSK